MTEFGRLIRLWRGDLSLSQAAAKIGCTKAHLWEMEMGHSRNPTIRTLAGIARAYEGSVPYLAHLAARSLSSAPQPLGSAREATEGGQHKTNPDPTARHGRDSQGGER